MRNIPEKACSENQNTLFIFNTFSPPNNLAVYEIMWKNMVQSNRSQAII
jgi:hypothetical protein